MKRIKRILAMAGAVLLILMYLGTLACALLDTSSTLVMFRASVLCTILVPVLIWGYTVIYRLAKGRDEQELEETIHRLESEKKQADKT